MKRLFICTMLLLFCQQLFAQLPRFTIPDSLLNKEEIIVEPESFWRLTGDFRFNVSQVSLSNWVGGGESSVSLGSMVHLNLLYDREELIWENDVNISYGIIRQGDLIPGFRKTEDMFIFISKFRNRITNRWMITTILDFRSQMDEGFRFQQVPQTDSVAVTKISNILAPGVVRPSVGLTFKDPHLSITASPLAGKITLVLDDELAAVGSFGLMPGERVMAEVGSAINATYQRDFPNSIRLRTNLNIFSGFDRFHEVDIIWDGLITFKVTRFISTSLSAQLIYDNNILIPQDDGPDRKAVQFKNVLNISFQVDF